MAGKPGNSGGMTEQIINGISPSVSDGGGGDNSQLRAVYKAGHTQTISRFRASDAKAFCGRDVRKRERDETDENANDARCHGREILHT